MNILVLIAAAFIAAGLYISVGIPVLDYYRVFCVGTAVDAVVAGRREKKGKTYLTWGYTIGDTYYSHPAKRGRRKEERKEGDRGALLLKKDNPFRVYELSDPQKRIIRCIAGAVLIMCGITAAWASWAINAGLL